MGIGAEAAAMAVEHPQAAAYRKNVFLPHLASDGLNVWRCVSQQKDRSLRIQKRPHPFWQFPIGKQIFGNAQVIKRGRHVFDYTELSQRAGFFTTCQ
jgi:hypothetical protein